MNTDVYRITNELKNNTETLKHFLSLSGERGELLLNNSEIFKNCPEIKLFLNSENVLENNL